nr:YkgJ family cysteine cluster protein [Halobacterium sp. TGN-42-S1]
MADAIETIGFECTRCGACCKSESEPRSDEPATGERSDPGAEEDDPHTATVFPDEVREVQAAESDDRTEERDRRSGDAASRSRSQRSRDWRDVARPMPYGLDEDGAGETFEWALQTDSCGDCTFYEEDENGTGSCSVHGSRPLICQTYPFSVALGGTTQPMGEAVDSVGLEGQREAGETGDEEGMVRAHECEGLGRDISREDAESLASALKERAVRELEEAIDVRDNYEPANPEPGETVVHDSEGAKRPDGSTYGE